MSQQITVLQAIEIAAQTLKDYVDDNAVFYGKKQSLDVNSKTQAKENLGVFTGTEEPVGAQDGDIWFDEEDAYGAGAGVYVLNLDTQDDLANVNWANYGPGSVILVTYPA